MVRLAAPQPKERQEFLRWLRRSPPGHRLVQSIPQRRSSLPRRKSSLFLLFRVSSWDANRRNVVGFDDARRWLVPRSHDRRRDGYDRWLLMLRLRMILTDGSGDDIPSCIYSRNNLQKKKKH